MKNEVPFGQTVSYSGLAKLCNTPGANQAVGSAMSNNKICLIVPCHRVIKGMYVFTTNFFREISQILNLRFHGKTESEFRI